MIRKFFAFIESIYHKRNKHPAWYEHKYLIVEAYKTYNIPHILGEEQCYMTREFKTKQEALEYLDERVSRADRKLCCLYKEISL